jgi:hypothetical protein
MFSKKTILLFALACLSLSLQAQFFRFGNNMFGARDGGLTRAEIKLVPSSAVIGQQCAFVLEFEVPKNNIVEGLQVSGLPDTQDGAIEYLSSSFENLADGSTTNKNNIVKRFRLPIIFHKSYADKLEVHVTGNVGTRVERSGMSMSSFSGFQRRLRPLEINVNPLPEDGKPKDFCGAVGKSFALNAKLQPDKVHPGDLVTAHYEIRYDGYFPTNATPVITGLNEKDFTVYELKTQKVEEGLISWTQVLVPKSATATNSLTMSIAYYNLDRKAYDYVLKKIKPLEFVSTEAASTQNTSVIVTDEKGDKSVKLQSAAVSTMQVRFTPNDKSPIIATIPTTTSFKELSRYGNWIRISTPEVIGWIKSKKNISCSP